MRIPLVLGLAAVMAAGAAALLLDSRTEGHAESSSASVLASAPMAAAAVDPTGSWTSEAPRVRVPLAAPQNFQYYPYDARLTMVRIRQQQGRSRSRGFRGRGDPGWFHDYPTAEHNLSKIVRELTFVRIRVEDWGGNILTLDDPRLMQFPLAYMSEPGQWSITPEEATALREYLLKGGFLIFDDFGGGRDPGDMYNLAEQMAIALPELEWVRLDVTDDIFDSFFQIDPDNLELAASGASYRGIPVFYGLYEDNDREDGRLLVVAADGGDFGEFWEFSDLGYYPVDISNEAYKVGINYLVYALTH